jgi:hypothetical protein
MTSKFRHAAKMEHHKYDFDESTGKVVRRDGIENLIHTKGLSD